MRKPNLAKLQAEVDAWNAKYPVGQPVVLSMDSGEERTTKTYHEATILGGHTAVGWFEGVRGCYKLDRAHPITSEQSP